MRNVVDERRVFPLNQKPIQAGPIIYWMSRDQRVHDNWALLHAQELAQKSGHPLIVVFCLVPKFLEATFRQYDFLLKGLEEVEKELKKFSIPFSLLLGDPSTEILKFAKKVKCGVLITDFDPLKIKKQWKLKVANSLDFAFVEVDAHNIVPCRVASSKQEFGAYTIRPKIKKVLKEYLVDFPSLKKQHHTDLHFSINWNDVRKNLEVNTQVSKVEWCIPGEKAAHSVLNTFLKHGIFEYDQNRNDPTKNAQSDLSPYLHFGQISSQRIALSVQKSNAPEQSKQSFLEELIVRKELSDNFCFYNQNYDSVQAFPAWAQKTLMEHAHDTREYVYTRSDFEHARTHDPLWNAAQIQMVQTGKMHGYMRMYWAKKILEWTKNPADALAIAIFLNDKYELDGRDPNGYVGIAWSIGGVHDRAWFDRPIFGKIRFMSYNGCKSKFDIDSYIQKYKQ